MESRLELCAIIGLQDENLEWQPISNLIQESDGRALVAGVVDLQDADTRAVIDSRELVEPFASPRDALEELDVHLQSVAWLGFLIPLPPFTVQPVLLIRREPAHSMLDQDSMHA